jgi:hydrogenase maturation protease
LTLPPKTPHILVIGYGNTLRQDDGVGPRVAEELCLRVVDPRVQILVRPSLTPELAETISEVHCAVFIDASAELPPGVVQQVAVERVGEADMSLVHFLEPQALLAWSYDLYGRCPIGRAWLVGVEHTDLGEELSEGVARLVPQLTSEVEAYLAEQLSRLP